MLKGIDFAISLYGFTERFIKEPDYGFEQMFQEVSALGVQKVELVGAQMFQNYPTPADAEIEEVLRLAKQYNIEIYSYGGYVDMGRITGHDMTEEEMMHEVIYDLMTAKRLGASLLRSSFLPMSMLPKVAMMAEVYGIKIGFEMHAPDQPSSDKIRGYVDALKALNTKMIGIIPDFGCFIERPNQISIDRFLQKGAKKELLDYIIENRWNGLNEHEMTEKIYQMGGGEPEKLAVSEWFGFMSFGPADLAGFQEVLPYAIYFHGKFYHIDENCVESTIPYEKLLQMIVASGFEGVLLTEYEGHAFYLNDAVEQIGRHLQMERNLLNAIA